jgi:glycosyltransferase involved in cell wall biosynthesis
MAKFISIVTPCFNEAENIGPLITRIRAVMATLAYDYEHILIDNASTDGTVDAIRHFAAQDARIKLIVNARNFGHIRSPYHALMQAQGDACIGMASDLQDPPENIPKLIERWEAGYKIVLAVKEKSEETWPMSWARRAYYRLMGSISEVPIVQNATGAGLYDRKVVEILRNLQDPYPFVRGLLCEIGYPIAQVVFKQPLRKHGVTKNGLISLYDIAMLGITNHSKVPLRIVAACGLILSVLSFVIGLAFLVAKLVWWNSFSLGTAPALIGIFFIGSAQMLFLGVIGEYIGFMHTKMRRFPLVVEQERVNFDEAKNHDAH